MSDFTPSIPISLQIRKIIFEKFNDVDTKFTNDDIFEILKSENDVDPSWIIDDTESLFNDLCDSGLVRNIAQNFTTIFLKLFDPIEKFHVILVIMMFILELLKKEFVQTLLVSLLFRSVFCCSIF